MVAQRTASPYTEDMSATETRPANCSMCSRPRSRCPGMRGCMEHAAAVRRKAHRVVLDAIATQWPEAYVVPGVGWCGPGWMDAAAYEDAHRPA